MASSAMTSNDHNPSFKITVLCKGALYQIAACPTAEDSLGLLNLQCNVSLTRGPSAIVESLVLL